MKTIPNIIVTATMLLLLAACGNEETSAKVLSLQVDGRNVALIEKDNSAQWFMITVEASADWQISSSADWCHLSNRSGNALSEPRYIKVSIDGNEDETSERTADITLTSANQARTLTVKQTSTVGQEDEAWETAAQAVKNFRTGWNLINTMDCCGDWIVSGGYNISSFETAWGKPLTTAGIFKKYKAAGFNVVRLPVTWYQHLDSQDNINEEWMARVETIVNYVLDAGMYCILNVHHDGGDGGWLKADWQTYPATSTKLKRVWTQIANRFKDYDHHLLFEGYNEVRDAAGQWTLTDEQSYNTMVLLAQDFVNTVRQTGGNNTFRNLLVNTYCCANVDQTMAAFSMPDDIVRNHLLAGVHVYEPYSIALDTESSVTAMTAEDESNIIAVFNRIQSYSSAWGVPVIIGEYGTVDKNNSHERAHHAGFHVREAGKRGIACILWDDLINRITYEVEEQEILDSITTNIPKW